MTPLVQMLLAALALWGWSGMHVEVSVVPIGRDVAARAFPESDLRSCHVEVDSQYLSDYYRGIYQSLDLVLLHEAGHCVGYWPEVSGGSPHSTNPESIMHASIDIDIGRILPEDWVRIKRIRDQRVSPRVIMPGIGKD